MVFTTQQVNGDATRVLVNLPNLARNVKTEDVILIADFEMQAKVFDQLVVARLGIGTAEDMTPVSADTDCLKAVVLVGHQEAAELLLH